MDKVTFLQSNRWVQTPVVTRICPAQVSLSKTILTSSRVLFNTSRENFPTGINTGSYTQWLEKHWSEESWWLSVARWTDDHCQLPTRLVSQTSKDSGVMWRGICHCFIQCCGTRACISVIKCVFFYDRLQHFWVPGRVQTAFIAYCYVSHRLGVMWLLVNSKRRHVPWFHRSHLEQSCKLLWLLLACRRWQRRSTKCHVSVCACMHCICQCVCADHRLSVFKIAY